MVIVIVVVFVEMMFVKVDDVCQTSTRSKRRSCLKMMLC